MLRFRIQVVLFALGFVAVTPLEVSAAEQGKPIVAVMPMEDETGTYSEEILRRATSYLRSSVASAEGVLVVEESRQNSKLEQIIDDKKRESYRECYDDDCQIPLGKALAADTILRASINRLDQCVLSLTLVDLAKEAKVDGAKVSLDCRSEESQSGLREAIDGGVSELFGGGVPRASTQSIEPESTSWTPDAMDERRVEFESSPDGAVVYVGGRLVCEETPCSAMVPAKASDVMMDKQRFERNSKTINLTEKRTVSFELTPRFGTLSVFASTREHELFVDGKKIGKTPFAEWRVTPGRHTIELKDKCFHDTTREIDIQREESKKLHFDLETKKSGLKIIAYNEDVEPVKAEVYVDGQHLGKTPQVFRVPLCSVSVRVKLDGYETWSKDLDLEHRETTEFDARLKSSQVQSYDNTETETEPTEDDSWLSSSDGSGHQSDEDGDGEKPAWLKSDQELMEGSAEARADGEKSADRYAIAALHAGLGGRMDEASVEESAAFGARWGLAEHLAVGFALEMGFDGGSKSYPDDSCEDIICDGDFFAFYAGPRLDIAIDRVFVAYVGGGLSSLVNQYKDEQGIDYTSGSGMFQYGVGFSFNQTEKEQQPGRFEDEDEGPDPWCLQLNGRQMPGFDEGGGYLGVRFGYGYC